MSEVLGEFEQLLLFALLELRDDEASGTTIRRSIEERTGRDPSPGAVHTALERLQRRGLVRSRLGETTPTRGGRRPRLYALEVDGAVALRDSYRTLTAMADGLDAALDGMAADGGAAAP